MNWPTLLEKFRRMNQRSLFGPARQRHAAPTTVPTTGPAANGPVANGPAEGDGTAPTGQARAEAVQRLQVGLFGIGAMVLLVGLASIIGSQADKAEDAAVPEAAPTTEPTTAPSQANPLADAGVVPDIVAEPGPVPSAAPLDLPPPRPSGSGNGAPAD